MTSRYELAQRAADAYDIYRAYFGVPEDHEAYARFFTPPVCNKAEPRMRRMMETTTRQGERLLSGTRVWGLMEKRYVYGLERWIPHAPQRAHLTVVVKNPLAEIADALCERLGVRNALIVYDKLPIPQVLMGGVIRKSVYAIRPVLEGDVKQALLALWKKHEVLR